MKTEHMDQLLKLKEEINKLYQYLNFAIVTNEDDIKETTDKILRLENEYEQKIIHLENGERK